MRLRRLVELTRPGPVLDVSRKMRAWPSLPLGAARLQRPASVFRYTFEHAAEVRHRQYGDDGPFAFFEARRTGRLTRSPNPALAMIPIEAVAPGDVQVLAAGDARSRETQVIDLDVLAGFPSVESVVASTTVKASRQLPSLRELLLSHAAMPQAETLRQLTGLQSLDAMPFGSSGRLDLDALPATQMRQLALTRWFTASFAPLERMTGIEQLKVDMYRDPVDPISKMTDLKYLDVIGPAKGWAKLRECVQLEAAHLFDVQIANLRRWNTWTRLRRFTLSGRGVGSLAGLEAFEQLEELTLLNLRMDDLSPLRELPRLTTLTLRMVPGGVDLESVAALPALRALVIEGHAAADVLDLPTMRPLAKAAALEELVLCETRVEDGDLMPLAELPRLRRLWLIQIAKVEALRAARPDIAIYYHYDHHPLPDPKREALKERVGAVTIWKPGEGLEQWSIFQSLAPDLGLETNYAAESRIKREVKRRDPGLAKRLDWDTEGGAVGVYANSEADIRTVANIVNDLVGLATKGRPA